MENHDHAATAKSRKPRPPVDFTRLPPEALLRACDFLRPGPVPLASTAWHERVADGRAPQPVVRGPRLTVWRWRDVQVFLEKMGG